MAVEWPLVTATVSISQGSLCCWLNILTSWIRYSFSTNSNTLVTASQKKDQELETLFLNSRHAANSLCVPRYLGVCDVAHSLFSPHTRIKRRRLSIMKAFKLKAVHNIKSTVKQSIWNTSNAIPMQLMAQLFKSNQH